MATAPDNSAASSAGQRPVFPPILRPCGPDDVDYLRDESRRIGHAEAISFPSCEAEIAEALSWARHAACPVTLQGSRTGITGGAVPAGGLILNLSRMNSIRPAEANPIDEAPRLWAGPGTTLDALRAACPSGWFFSPDPTETSASIGGMIACNASGALSFRYGPTRDSIDALRLLLEDGTPLELRRGRDRLQGLTLTLPNRPPLPLPELPPSPAVKNAAGYTLHSGMDALDLFIGSEGTLGIVTEALLHLRPAPAERWALLAFPATPADAAAAVETLRRTFRVVTPPPPAALAALEYFDAHSLDLLRHREDPIALQSPPGHVALYAEFHADTPAAAEVALLQAADILSAHHTDPDSALPADTPSALAHFKTFRHALPESVNALIDERRRIHPALVKLGSDMSVPDARLADVMHLYQTSLDASGLEYVIFGHIGDNHLHINILPNTPDDLTRGRALYRQLADTICAWGGSLSAEHGIGKAKTDLLRRMYSPDALQAMTRIRDMLAPLRLLNPANLSI